MSDLLPTAGRADGAAAQHDRDERVVTRVMYGLDRHGYVIKIGWWPEGAVGDVSKCVRETHHLIATVNQFLHTLDTWRESIIDDPQRRQGYRQAIEEILSCDEAAKLRNCIADLRPYLAMTTIASKGGFLFPQNGQGLPDVAGGGAPRGHQSRKRTG